MSRLIALPFAVLLGVISFGLVMTGVAILEDQADGSTRQEASFMDVAAFSQEENEADESGAIAGASLVGFGVLGFIGAVALLIASLTGDSDRGVPAPAPLQQQQQQQQQVVVVQRPDGSVEVRDR